MKRFNINTIRNSILTNTLIDAGDQKPEQQTSSSIDDFNSEYDKFIQEQTQIFAIKSHIIEQLIPIIKEEVQKAINDILKSNQPIKKKKLK